jgi:hypothetical protein
LTFAGAIGIYLRCPTSPSNFGCAAFQWLGVVQQMILQNHPLNWTMMMIAEGEKALRFSPPLAAATAIIRARSVS